MFTRALSHGGSNVENKKLDNLAKIDDLQQPRFCHGYPSRRNCGAKDTFLLQPFLGRVCRQNPFGTQMGKCTAANTNSAIPVKTPYSVHQRGVCGVKQNREIWEYSSLMNG